ncbi:MAG: arginase family protein [Nanoarchaeota archaeon]
MFQQVGIRAYSSEEWAYILQHKGTIRTFEWSRFSRDGQLAPTPGIKEIVGSVSTDKVYLTVDVDGFDPAVMPETGTPVPGGFGWEFGLGLAVNLFKN